MSPYIVSHETKKRLEQYETILSKWNSHINLIGRSTSQVIWGRHIKDALQLMPYIKNMSSRIIDVGSGAGIPGIILAIAGCQNVVLIESDRRKAIFLNECVRELHLDDSVIVKNERVENIKCLEADIMVSRACASLNILIDYARLHLVHGGECLLLKGQAALEEIKLASHHGFSYDLHENIIGDGYIIHITEL